MAYASEVAAAARPATLATAANGASCTDACSGEGLICADGNWGIDGLEGFREALVTTGEDPENVGSGPQQWCRSNQLVPAANVDSAPYVEQSTVSSCRRMKARARTWPAGQARSVG
eukprot:COSAG02_NODE_15182_length_1196_cov_1.134002_1_plen_116_part_00